MDTGADARAEARLELGLELRDVGLTELVRERDEAREVVLAGLLALAETVGRLLEPAELKRRPLDRLGRRADPAAKPLQQAARAVARQQRGALERDPRPVEHLLVVGRARVRAKQDSDLLEGEPLAVQRADPPDDERTLLAGIAEPTQLRLGPVLPRRAQLLLGAAEPRHEPVRELEHLRRRAVVLLEPEDLRAPAQREQVLGRGAREAVDRLVVVADHAEVVAIAEPVLEERLLEQVDVLVLVDGERPVPGAEVGDRARVRLVEPHGALEQVLEVDRARGGLALLVGAVDLQHQVGRERRLALAERRPVARRRDAAVLRPLDLGREVPRGAEAVSARQPVRDLPQQERLRGEDPADLARREVAQLRERRRVERARPHAAGAEGREPRPHLARRLVGERDGEDLGRRERARCDLVRDPPSDRRRLPRPGPREDAHRPAHGLDRAALLRIEPFEDHRPTVPSGAAGERAVSATYLPEPRRRSAAARARSPRGARPPRACRPPRRAARARSARLRARPRRSRAASRGRSSRALSA